MATVAQAQLAHKIASKGIWPYSKVIELMDKNSKFIDHLKVVLDGGPVNVANAEESAYINARLAEEIGASKFGSAYVFYMRRGTDVAKYIGDISAKIAAVRAQKPEITTDWIKAQRERWLSERSTYMQQRIATCQENDPFAGVAQ